MIDNLKYFSWKLVTVSSRPHVSKRPTPHMAPGQFQLRFFFTGAVSHMIRADFNYKRKDISANKNVFQKLQHVKDESKRRKIFAETFLEVKRKSVRNARNRKLLSYTYGGIWVVGSTCDCGRGCRRLLLHLTRRM